MPIIPVPGRVSIVTPCLNGAAFLDATIESVLAQTYPDVEYMLVDGGSTDGSTDIALRHNVKVLHVAGSSQSHAVNVGFGEASGEFFGFLNADDLLTSSAIEEAVRALQADPTAPFAYGNGLFIDVDGNDLGPYPVLPFSLGELEKACFICQPATLVRSRDYKRIGGLDEALDLAMDYDLWFRMTARGESPIYVPKVWASARMHTQTKTFRERERMYREVAGMLKSHRHYVPFSWAHAYAGFLVDGRDQFFLASIGSPRRTLLTLLLGLRFNGFGSLRFMKEFVQETLRLRKNRRQRSS